MRVGIAAGIAVTVLVSGCSENLFGMCPTHFPGATWQEDGIYAHMAGIGETKHPDPGLPFNHASGSGNLSAVLWTPDSAWELVSRIELSPSPQAAFPRLDESDAHSFSGPTVTMMVENAVSRATVDSAFTHFLQKVTSGTPEQIRAWSSLGLRQTDGQGDGDDFFNHRVSVPGPFRLESLYNETAAGPRSAGLNSGFEWHNGGNWGFRFYFGERSATLPNAVTVTADSRDVVSAQVPGEPRTTNSTLERIKEGFRGIGVEVAGPEPGQFTMAQC
jgi:hypothetical protein